MTALLHISDLHRTSGPRINNDHLLAAIASDATRWAAEGIARPDVVVVSGDLVQGARIGDPDADGVVSRQYEEADDFLSRLATEFVGGDRHRVVIVPGNHDVNWPRAYAAMSPLATCPPDISQSSLEVDSGIRWDWSTRQALQITDPALYASRLDHFRSFRAAFYEGVTPSPLIDGDLVFFDYPELGVAILGFPSCHGNDCFCYIGEIEPRLVALSREVLSSTAAPLAIAVWHHSLAGGPRAQDYMDRRVIHQLIDYGFSLGLHGHQHFPAAAPYEMRLPNLTAMAVVSAGSLAAGDRDLPMGEARQFNIVVPAPATEEVTVHVRAMSSEGVFMGSHRDDFGGRTSMSLPLKHSQARPKPPSPIRILDDAIAAIEGGSFETALKLLARLGPEQDPGRRQVLIKALSALDQQDTLLAVLDPPQSVDEALHLIALRLKRFEFDEAERTVSKAGDMLEEPMAKELAARIQAEKAIRT